MFVLDGRLKPVDRLAFSPDGNILAVAGGDRKPMYLWRLDDPSRPQHRLSLRLDLSRWVFAFNPRDGSLIVAQDTEVICFDPTTGGEIWRIEPAMYRVISGLSISATGEQMAIGFLYQIQDPPVGGYQIWRLNGAALPTQLGKTGSPDLAMSRGVAYLHPDNRFVTAEDHINTTLTKRTEQKHAQLVVLDAATGERMLSVISMYQMIDEVIADPTGVWVAGRCGAAILVWAAVQFDQPPAKIANTNRKHFTGVAFHPSGRYLAATSNDATVKFYDTATRQMAKAFTWSIGRLRSIAFSPDGLLAAAGSDSGKIIVWDVDL